QSFNRRTYRHACVDVVSSRLRQFNSLAQRRERLALLGKIEPRITITQSRYDHRAFCRDVPQRRTSICFTDRCGLELLGLCIIAKLQSTQLLTKLCDQL